MFVRAGKQLHSQPKPAAGLFTWASDLELQVNLGKQLKFLVYIVTPALRPDMVLTSATCKQLLLLELTVPWEDCIDEANKRKQSKYQELVEECRRAD